VSTRKIIHIITPGDHFSPSTGSAIPTIVHNLSVAGAKSGSLSYVVVDETTRKDRYTSAEVIDCAYKTFRLGKIQKICDLAIGRVSGIRRKVANLYFPALEAISQMDAANIILHNACPHPSLMKRIAPQHFYYCWLNNDVLRYYGHRERNGLASSYDGIICCSDYIRNSTLHGLRPELHNRIHVVQNGVDPVQFDLPIQKRDKMTILFIGRVVYEKGVHVLVEAAIDLFNQGFDFSVNIVGRCGFDNNDPLSAYELKLREAASNFRDIEFLPFARREEIPAIMASADILVVPSVWPDPNPLVVKEGLASGLAAVCSDIGGIPEMFEDKSLLFRPNDSVGLTGLLKQLLQDNKRVESIGDANRLAVQKFTWEKQYGVLLDVFDRR
jgi:glycosyltransferase involved in cell wall biosynthesis